MATVVQTPPQPGVVIHGATWADYEAMLKINPRLIYCSITGFGASGPQAGQAGYDYLVQAQGGLMSLTGWADGAPGAGPMRSGLAVSDLTTGMNAANGGPTYGRKRRTPAPTPQSDALGIPIKYSAIPISRP